MSRLMDPERLQKEIEAQKKRAEALALLESHGAERHYKAGEVTKTREEREVDNTLEVVTLRRAQQTYRELSAKDRLLRQQNSFREGLEQKQSRTEQAAKSDAQGPLAQGWREVKDANTGATYYWNKNSNTTSWEQPVATAQGMSTKSQAKDEAQDAVDRAVGEASSSSPSPSTKISTEASSGAGAGAGANTESKDDVKIPRPLGPLPPGWTQIKDPNSGGFYYWNKSTRETSWVRPEVEEGGESDGVKSSVEAAPGLPHGWKAVTHAATGQMYYVHEASGKRSFSLPGSQTTQESVQLQGQGQENKGSSSRDSKGRDRGAGATGRQQGHKKRGRSDPGEIDPLDPTGKAGGKWSDGLVQVGERMADSTASGPLWQQRPYPAPGKVLRGRAPSDSETAGPRQKG